MNNAAPDLPEKYGAILAATQQAGFTMASDALTCTLLRTLAAAKPAGSFLELGTGTGLSTACILQGMDAGSGLTSIDHDAEFLSIAKAHLRADDRLQLICTDAGTWLQQNRNLSFDYIFADTWHGKFLLLDETLAMLKKGGFYLIDDLLPQPNWPEGHAEKVVQLISFLENRNDLFLTKQHWATGCLLYTSPSPRD